MNKKYRLRKNSEFQKVYKRGKNYWNRYLVLYTMKNGQNYTRVGFSLTKKYGNSVERNRIRRQMKEIYRLNSNRVVGGYDLIFIPKIRIKKATYKEIEDAMLGLLKRSRLLKIR